MRSKLLSSATLVVALSACAGNPEPGEPGYAFNVEGEYAAEFVDDDGQTYSGTMQLSTGEGGAVSGTMSLTDPMTIGGTAEGLVVGAQLQIAVSYTIPDTGCSGVASGTGTIEEGGGRVAGDVEIEDECGDAPSAATFALTRS